MIKVSSRGSFSKFDAFAKRMKKASQFSRLEYYGQLGVDALAQATPIDSALTAESWTYEITKKNGKYTISWHNTNVVDGVPVAILIQYGHATGTGGWVQGHDYINPAIKPVFDKIADEVWKEVTRNG